ncbi:hypothetical protein OC861_006945, partial [Tilletia horrida]
MMQSPAETNAGRLHGNDNTQPAACEQARTALVGQLSSLPVEIVQIILDHLVTLISPKERIHFHKNHQVYNRYLSELGRIALVNKLFHTLLVPYLFREIRLPRKFGYASSVDDDYHSTMARECDSQVQDPHITTDSSAMALAQHLKDHPEKAALVKRLHIDPVARTQERDATDCDAYTAILQQCSNTVEELAIAVNCSNADKRTFDESDSQNQALQRIAKARMPQLKHLMLKSNDLGHLDWIAWDQLNSLEEVTVLTEYLFHPDAEFIDFEDVTEDDNNVLEVLLRLPSTVKKLTFAFVYTFEWFNLAYGVRNETNGQHGMTQFVDALAFTLEKARNHGKIDHLDDIRLVWTHDPDDGDRCECCLMNNRSKTYPLPQLRRCTPLEERCAERLAAEVSTSDQEQSKGMGT